MHVIYSCILNYTYPNNVCVCGCLTVIQPIKSFPTFICNPLIFLKIYDTILLSPFIGVSLFFNEGDVPVQALLM